MSNQLKSKTQGQWDLVRRGGRRAVIFQKCPERFDIKQDEEEKNRKKTPARQKTDRMRLSV